MIVTAGKTSVSIFVYFVDDDSGVAPGEGTTGLLFSDIETGGSASYVRQGGARVDFTLVTLASASAAWTVGGFILVDNTNMPGLYRVDIPNAALVTGVDQVVIELVAAAGKNTLMRPKEIDITDVDLRNATSAGLTNLNATITSRQPSGNVDLNADQSAVTIGVVTTLTNLPAITANWLTAAGIAASALNGKGDWNIGKTGYALTTAGILAIWDQLESAVVTAATMGLKIKNNLNATITSRQPSGAVDLNADQSAVTVGTVTTLTNLPAITANWLTAAGIAAGALDGKGNWNIGKTGYALTTAGILAIWHQLEAAIITAGTIGLKIKDNLNATISSRQPSGAVTVGTINANVIDAASLAAGAVDKIRDGLLPTQNTAFNNIEFLFVSSTDHVTPVTAASGTSVTRSIDGGAFAAATGALAEVGNGIYQYDASAADMNGGIINFRFIATGGTPVAPDDRFLTIVTGGGV
jgi:hypothetical protein